MRNAERTVSTAYYEKYGVEFERIAREIEEFFMEYFAGAVKVYNNLTVSHTTFISHVGLALFTKRLLTSVFSQNLITLKIYNESEHMIFDILYNECRELSESRLNELNSLAVSAGFKTEFYNDFARIIFLKSDASYLSVYAKSNKIFISAFKKTFGLEF
jgi:hypothetical protein